MVSDWRVVEERFAVRLERLDAPDGRGETQWRVVPPGRPPYTVRDEAEGFARFSLEVRHAIKQANAGAGGSPA